MLSSRSSRLKALSALEYTDSESFIIVFLKVKIIEYSAGVYFFKLTKNKLKLSLIQHKFHLIDFLINKSTQKYILNQNNIIALLSVKKK